MLPLLLMLVLAAALAGCGDDGEGGGGGAATPEPQETAAALPAQQETDVRAAARAAGCELSDHPEEGADHDDREFTPADYRTNPPTSGDHFPQWAEDGVYPPGQTPPLGQLVHALEHGRVLVQYRDPELASPLQAFVDEKQGRHLLLFQNETQMPFAVAASAWTHLLGCAEMNDRVYDALRTFYDAYVDKAPELVP